MIKNTLIFFLMLGLGLSIFIIKKQVEFSSKGTQIYNQDVSHLTPRPLSGDEFTCSYDSVALLNYNEREKELHHYFNSDYSNSRLKDYQYDISDKSNPMVIKSSNDYKRIQYLGKFDNQVEILSQGTGSFIDVLDGTSEGQITEIHSIDVETGQAFLIRKVINLDQSNITRGPSAGPGVETSTHTGTCKDLQ